MVTNSTKQDITEFIGIALLIAFGIAIWPVTALVAEYTFFCNIWEEHHNPDNSEIRSVNTRTYVIASVINIILTILWFIFIL